jgi:pyrimidine operon attenuation protein/uracil phosphoribosyltransferase
MTLPDAEQLCAALARELAPRIGPRSAMIGIHTGGAWLAERLASRLPGAHPLGFIDVSYYRDDYALSGLKPNARRTTLPFDVSGATIVLIDDVLYTGRSVRAAINELFDFGRPERIELAVLVDRGGRELPVEPTYFGVRLAVARDLSIVLSRDAAGKLALGVGPPRSREREPRARRTPPAP